MVFSSITFLYYFLPVVFFVYFLIPAVKGKVFLKNTVLLISSLVFYAWGEPRYVLLMAAQCIATWGFGLIIGKYRYAAYTKIIAAISVIINLSGLLFYKYADFFIVNLNNVTSADLPLLKLALPIGISFYTFQLISYTIDLYRGKFEAQRNPVYFGAYVTSFPQLIAGPIVRYTDIMNELSGRVHSLTGFAEGTRRFIIGLGKKVLLANVFGELVAVYKLDGDSSVLFAWLYIIAFTLQIYFDFSGYSDMAIGLGRIFGFKFPENFNYPYIADSITDFWKRWHMTLSAWFRDYIYFSLGGSKGKTVQTIFCLMFIWMITGFWHGADWNFILWGGYYGVVLLIERYFLRKILYKCPAVLKHLYTMLIVIIGWVFFDAGSFAEAFSRLGFMFGAGSGFASGSGIFSSSAVYYLRSYLLVFIIGIIAATPLPAVICKGIRNACNIRNKKLLVAISETAALAAVLIFSTAAITDGSYNPFIYFRF